MNIDDYDAKGAAMLLVREIAQHDPNLIGSKEWTKIFNKALAIKALADKARNQSGSILPEICWLFATLLLAAPFIVPTVRHYDGQTEARLNQLINMEGK